MTLSQQLLKEQEVAYEAEEERYAEEVERLKRFHWRLKKERGRGMTWSGK